MIAGRRDRKRPLIRSNAMAGVMAKKLSPMGDVKALQKERSLGSIQNRPVSSFAMSATPPEITTYLRQLSSLHAGGILTDDEFAAASGRLLGS